MTFITEYVPYNTNNAAEEAATMVFTAMADEYHTRRHVIWEG